MLKTQYEEAEKDLEITVVKVFDEDMTFYRDTKGEVFPHKQDAIYSQSKINKYENGVCALRNMLKDRLINLNDDDLISVAEDIRKIQNMPMVMMANPYNIIFKVYSASDYTLVLDKINNLGIFPIPLKKYSDYKYPEDKSYDVVFINTAECRMTTLSSLKDLSYKYIEAFNTINYKIKKYYDHQNV